MLTIFMLKNRATNVSREAFEEYMSNDRPPLLESIEEIEGYELWFPTDEATYDSVETMIFADRDSMRRALDSSVAAKLHETGSRYIDFETEELLRMESVREFGADGN